METDPVLIQRAKVKGLTAWGKRAGYGSFLIASIAFFIGFATSYSTLVTTITIAGLIIGSLILAPAIVFGYAVAAADRADREQSW